jgi:hypothetical protein
MILCAVVTLVIVKMMSGGRVGVTLAEPISKFVPSISRSNQT